MQYIIEADKPYPGHVLSVLCDNGTVAYSEGLTLAQYEQEHGIKTRLLSEAELFTLCAEYENGLKTAPAQISEARYWEMLEILPPCRWHTAGGFEIFHVSEHLTGDLVSWFAHRTGTYWEWTDSCRISSHDIGLKLRKATDDAMAAAGLDL